MRPILNPFRLPSIRWSALSCALAAAGLLGHGSLAEARSASREVPSLAKLQARLAPPLQAQAGGLLRLLIRLSRQEIPPDSKDEPEPSAGDPGWLPLALPAIVARLDGLIPGLPTALLDPVQRAREAFAAAEQQVHRGRSGSDAHLDYLKVTMTDMARGAGALDEALDLAAQIDPRQIALLLPAVEGAREAARRHSQGLVDLALAIGVSRGRLQPALDAIVRADVAYAAANYELALIEYGNGFGFAANTVVFSIDRFEQNLRSVFDSETVGYAYALSQGGALARSGANGLARTGADAPATLQSSTRRMHVASVSKTLTSIVVLPLLVQNGLTPDSAIGPWLPSHWARSADFDALTFRELMTHRSGVGQLGDQDLTGSSYPALQAMVQNPIGSKGFNYDNANFGLLRVLAARLVGVDAGAFGEFDGGVLTASAFILRAQQVYGAVGTSFSCDPSAVNPTIEYDFPDSGNPGYNDPPKSLSCGGYGAFISAQDLANALAYLRYTEQLMSAETLQQMKSGYLGWMNPSSYSFAQGEFGVYHSHGGDWDHTGSGGLDACVMMYPIQVEAALVINSSRKALGVGYTNGGYQCTVLKWAFENAWVPQ